MNPLPRLLPPDLRGPADPPWELLADLRAIDATADLLMVAPGVWWLMKCTMNGQRMTRGLRMVVRHRQMAREGYEVPPKRAMMCILMAAGAAFVAEYHMAVPDSSIVNDFRERDHNYRHRLREVIAENQAISRGDVRTAEIEKHAVETVGLAMEGYDYARYEPVSINMPTPAEIKQFGSET